MKDQGATAYVTAEDSHQGSAQEHQRNHGHLTAICDTHGTMAELKKSN